jgi:hypothetical protein
LGLTFFNLLCLLATAALGYCVVFYGHTFATYHQLAGSLSTVACCAVHCVVFTYFMATAKWIQHAVDVKNLDRELIAPTRSFKAQAFPAAIGAMLIVFITAVVGVATISYGLRSFWHHILAWLSIFVNIFVATVEYRAILKNGKLIDTILAKINAPGPQSPV